MGEAKRRAASARLAARQSACGWDANGAPSVEDPKLIRCDRGAWVPVGGWPPPPAWELQEEARKNWERDAIERQARDEANIEDVATLVDRKRFQAQAEPRPMSTLLAMLAMSGSLVRK